AYANLAMPALLRKRRLTGRDAAFATELLAGTCRWQGSYDTIIAAAAGRPLKEFQPAVVDLLRLGAHQILAMRVPTPVAVAAGVDLAAATVGERVTGLVNAVLRRIAERSLDEWLDQLSEGLDDHDRLALRTAHPRWIVDAYAELLDPSELEQALAANNHSPAISLAVRPGLAEVDDLVRVGAEASGYSPFAARWRGDPAELALVRDGRVGVQDEGSQLVTWALTRVDALPGWWLDLCAGPGGKSALLAGLTRLDGSKLLAADLAPHRALLVAAALRRYAGDETVPTVVVADGTRPPWRSNSFTRVLADVPCTGLGALRRRPESRWRRGPADVEQLHPLQLALLAAAIDSAVPGGVVGYVTCSPHRRETSDVLSETLAVRSDVEVIPAAQLLPEVPDAALGPYLQLWPHRHGTDAMFAGYLRKTRSH
ncbi:MAG: RsmB/NOP family class I SAM-dependent RNA methyltransferase, partial [Propionibacteriaceae bacterium]